MDPLLRWVDERGAPPDVAAMYARWRAVNPHRTEIPGIIKAFSLRPDVGQQIIGLSYDLHFRDGFLPWKTKELLATYVSALNRCPYCTSSHAYFLEVTDDRPGLATAIAAADLADGLTDAERALLRYARILTEASHQITESDVTTLLAAGWSNEQIGEAAYVVAMFNFYNRVANAFGLPAVDYHGILDRDTVARGFDNPFSS